jgi:predicted secreted protein
MFDDKRSKRVVLVVHCILNHNARIDGCAYYPGPMTEIVEVLADAGVGIVQMPCPELDCLGLDRSGRIREGEDIGIREALLGEARAACQALVQGVMRDVMEYRKHGFAILGVVGNDGSPACGVDFTHYLDSGFQPGAGAFVTMLREELERRGIALPFVATQDHQWTERLERIRALVSGEAKP